MSRRGAEEWAKWRGLVFEQGQSGGSVAAFCGERGLREWQFYEWKKRLRNAEAAQFVEVRPAAEPVQ
ncbi:MAG: IS66 family insertion sequence element accessory protein TnpA, partial [Candidatus Saccharimonadales bacterium]